MRQLADDTPLPPVHDERAKVLAAASALASHVEYDVAVIRAAEPLQHCTLLPVPRARRTEEVPTCRHGVRVEHADRDGVAGKDATSMEVRTMS